MTEAEWLACADPRPMLEYAKQRKQKVSQRKLRLFGVACCRGIWDLLTDDRLRHAVEVAERHAEGEVDDAELEAARVSAREVVREAPGQKYFAHARAVEQVCSRPSIFNPGGVCCWATSATRKRIALPKVHAALLRDVIGPSLFRRVDVPSRWLTSAVLAVAESIDKGHDFQAMPVLADALEDAGCTNGEILSHLRSPGPHTRGCWVVDRVRSVD